MMLRSAIISGFLLMSACGSSSTPPCTASNATATTSVQLKGYAFEPACVSVTKGQTVTFTNADPTTHTVTTTSGNDSFDSGDLKQTNTYTHTFNTAGTVGAYCKYHTYMTLTVLVN